MEIKRKSFKLGWFLKRLLKFIYPKNTELGKKHTNINIQNIIGNMTINPIVIRKIVRNYYGHN